MSETGAAAFSSGSRAVETATRALIDILKLLVEAKERRLRAQLNKEHLKQARENRKLSEMSGHVESDDLQKLAEKRHTRVIATDVKISEKNLDNLRQLAEERGFSFAAVGDKSRSSEIAQLKSKIGYLQEKGNYIQQEIGDIRQQRISYIKEIEKNGKTLSDDVLKGFDNKISELNKQYMNQEYLNEADRAEYNALNEKLYGDPIKGTKGLTQINEEMSVMILESDLPLVYSCMKELQDKAMRENVEKAIDALKYKEKTEGLTDEEKLKLNALQNKETELINNSVLEHNGATKKEVFDNMFNSLSKSQVDSESGKAYNLQGALNRFVKSESIGSGKPIYVVNPKNPESYIKVSKEYDQDRRRVIHTYDVYKDGEQQTASQLFGTDGIYTDRNSTEPNGKPRYIDKSGNDVQSGGLMYWTALRNEMAEKTNIDDNVFVFTSEEMLKEYQTAFREAKEEQEQQIAEQKYDITENLDISPEEVEQFKDVVTSTNFLNTDSLTEDCKEELEKQGYYYTSGTLGKESYITNRQNGEKTTFDDLRNRLRENPQDKTAAILACNMRKIQAYTQLAAVQTDIYMKSGSINDEKTVADMKALSLRHEELTNEIKACDDRLNVYLTENKIREVIEKDMPNKTEYTHGEEFENGEVQQTLEQVKADADREQAEYGAINKAAALNNERNIADDKRVRSINSDIGDNR